MGGRAVRTEGWFQTRTPGCKLTVNVFWLGSEMRIVTIKQRGFGTMFKHENWLIPFLVRIIIIIK